MASAQLRTLISTVLLTAFAGAAQPAWAVLPISAQPLTLPNKVPPAFIMALDNSGSMGSDETLCHTSQGGCYWNGAAGSAGSFFDAAGVALEAGTNYVRTMHSNSNLPQEDKYGAARDPEFNRAFFNPANSYTPWVQADSCAYTGSGADGSVIANFIDQNASCLPGSGRGNAKLNSAPEDSRHPKTATAGGTGLTINFTTFDPGTFSHNYVATDRLAIGVEYLNNNKCSNQPTPGVGVATGTWQTVTTTDLVFVAACSVQTRFYPATVYLTPGATPPPGFDLTKRVLIKFAGPAGSDLYKYQFVNPADATKGNFTSAVTYQAAMQNFANYWTYYGDRVRAVVAGATQAFDGVDGMRVGAFNINNPITNWAADPKVTMYDLSVTAPRQSLYTQLLAFDSPGNNTPTRRAVFRLGNQFRRVKSAADPDPPILLSCQANAGMLFTDGYINDDNGGLPAVGNVDGALGAPYNDAIPNTMADIASYSYVNNLRPDLAPGKVAVPAGCAAPVPSPKLDCQKNLHMNFFGIPLGARGKFYDVPPYVDNLATASTDEATNQAFIAPPAWNASGLCNSCGGTDLTPPAVDDLWHASMDTRGKFISAQSPAAVRDGIRSVINSILDAVLPSGSQSVAGAHLGAGSLTYAPSFQSSDSGTDWTGTLIGNKLLADGSLGPQVFDSGALLTAKGDPLRSSRDIIIVKTPGNSLTRQAVPLSSGTPGSFGPDEATQLAFFGLSQAPFHAKYDPNPASSIFATVPMVIDYVKGVASNEQRNSGTFRNRTGVMGDVINSIPEVSSATDDYGYQDDLTAADQGGAVYAAFLASKATRSPSIMVYLGANDGMLHAFNGTSVAGKGQEVFGLIPNSVANKLGKLLDPTYVHNFYVDGNMNVQDAFVNGGWKTVLVGSTGVGGSGMFALDVSDPSTFAASYSSTVMWELTKASDPDIGQNVGRPQVFIGEDGAWYAAFGNGYNSTNSNPGLILVNLSTGTIAKKLMGNDGGNYDNGIGPIAAIDITGPAGVPDGKVDAIYGGDYRGNMWKFDLSGNTSGSWTVANGGLPLYVAHDGAGNPQPITGGIDIAPGPIDGVMVYFGTGSYFLTGDNDAVTPPAPVQSLYGVWDNGSAVINGRADLQAQTINSQTTTTLTLTGPPVSTVDVTTRATSNNSLTFSLAAGTKRGFFMDLQVGVTPATAIGERFTGTPLVLNGVVYYTTFEPTGDACSPGVTRWEYGLGTLTGAPALNNEHIGTSTSNPSTCPGGGCGGVQVGHGSPQPTSTIVVPQKGCSPGDIGCSTAIPGAPASDDTFTKPCVVTDRTDPLQARTHQRNCGRQSWRQVR